MIVCKGCTAENTEDSKFCKLCGAALELTKPAISPEDVEPMLKDGFKLVQEGRTVEALFLANSLVEAAPQSHSAYALLGMAHEESGDIRSAVEAYEKVVELNPESAIDRIKLGQLKRKLEVSAAPEELEVRARNWVAGFSAVAAALAVATLGVILALGNGRAQAAEKDKLIAANSFNNGAQGFQLLTQAQQAQQPQQQQQAGENSPVSQPATQQLPIPGGTNRSVPKPMERINAGNRPLTLEISPSSLPNSNISVRPQPPNTQATNTQPTPKPDPGIVEPKRPGPGRIVIAPAKGGAMTGSDSAVSENIYRVAQQKMAGGDYAGAIRDFTVALSGSRKPALIHQLIGRCYSRIGDAASARSHFQTALQMYEAAGNVNEAKACKRELDLLDG